MASEQRLDVLRRNRSLRVRHAARERIGTDLQVLEAQALEPGEVERKRLDVIHRKGKAEIAEGAKIGFTHRSGAQHGASRELEHDLGSSWRGRG